MATMRTIATLNKLGKILRVQALLRTRAVDIVWSRVHYHWRQHD
jgi:hypothetical protein